MSKPVRAKKHLGQHFLTNEVIAQKIGDTLTFEGYKNVIEIGPGTGVLTKYLLEKPISLVAMEIDRDSIIYLNENFHSPKLQVLEADHVLRAQEAGQLTGKDEGDFPL